MKLGLMAAGIAAMAVAGSASAYSLQFLGYQNGSSVSGNYRYGNAGGYTGTGNGGLFIMKRTDNNQVFNAYCGQLGDQNFGGNYTETQLQNIPETANGNPPNPVPMGYWKGLAVSWVVGSHWNTGVSDATGDTARAVQLCIWEIIYSSMSGDVDTFAELSTWMKSLFGNNADGNSIQFQASISGANTLTALGTLANNLIGSAADNQISSGYGLTSVEGQDLVTVPVPFPAVLAGLGLIGVGALRRRMKK